MKVAFDVLHMLVPYLLALEGQSVCRKNSGPKVKIQTVCRFSLSEQG